MSAAFANQFRCASAPYRADNDQNSKITFNRLNILFQLQATGGSGKSPLLTLPVGG